MKKLMSGLLGFFIGGLFSYSTAAAMIDQYMHQAPLLGGGSGGDTLTCVFDRGAFDIEYDSSKKTIMYYDGLVTNPQDKLLANRGQFVAVYKSDKPMAKFEPQPGQKFQLFDDSERPIVEIVLNYQSADHFPYRVYPFSAIYTPTGQRGFCETTTFPSVDPLILYYNLK